ncbi:zinc-binding dehydrogenase [Paracoccus sp. YIM 132242]|uniref:Zinc-binding dehydrogenase n=1 Tax=Paracoccus lichenicola TaxID=2665644 RepID=A0A6L6HM87_9RHOB|nr:NADPH:quinone oxidoreductase family protein [Paracoccus lichenicola]MTE00287.1 zinc-binding dehydrogenase [Paracoccus lichenicola]
MKAMVCKAFGGLEDLSPGILREPKSGPGEILIGVRAAGVNFPDVLILRGAYQVRPAPPFAPGFEVAGTVLDGTDKLPAGTRVMALTASGHGGFAARATARLAEAVRIPDGMDDITAAGFHTVYGTAFHALQDRGGLRAGETLVVLGAGGGVGLAAVEIGVALGARVIAVAGGAEKCAAAVEHGAHETIDHRAEDLRDRVREMTGGQGADVCLDVVGGDAFHVMSRCMNWGGRLLTLGYASGTIPSLPANLPMLKGYALVGVYWGQSVVRDPAGHQQNFARLADLWRAGKLRPKISRVLPFSRAVEALRAFEARTVVGKIVLTPDE